MNAVAPVLALRAVSHRYPAAAAATLSNIDLAIGAGEIVAVVGASGCGKTTLVRLLAGLEQPQAGSIRVDGEPLVGPHPRIGVVFQEPRLLPWLSVAANVGFGLESVPYPERERRVRHALERVQLGAYATRWPHQLSGGQAQRVAIARALAVEPELILMDEPFSALDPATRRALQDEVAALWAGGGGALLLVTHDPDEALVLADHVIVLAAHPGRIATTLSIDLPRPRCRDDAAFTAARCALLDALAQAGSSY